MGIWVCNSTTKAKQKCSFDRSVSRHGLRAPCIPWCDICEHICIRQYNQLAEVAMSTMKYWQEGHTPILWSQNGSKAHLNPRLPLSLPSLVPPLLPLPLSEMELRDDTENTELTPKSLTSSPLRSKNLALSCLPCFRREALSFALGLVRCRLLAPHVLATLSQGSGSLPQSNTF